MPNRELCVALISQWKHAASKQVAMKYSDKKEDYEGIFSTLTIPFFQLL